jgi:heat-inducible transcriptional repressor
MLTERQKKLLNFLVKEYICTSGPVSSKALKKVVNLDICGATIRNDLQALMKEGFIIQPHTSAGRIPTKKAYKFLAERVATQNENEFPDFIVQQIKDAHKQIAEELKLAEELMRSLSQASTALSIKRVPEKNNLFEILTILGTSRPTYNKNIDIINKIIKQFENF